MTTRERRQLRHRKERMIQRFQQAIAKTPEDVQAFVKQLEGATAEELRKLEAALELEIAKTQPAQAQG